MKTIKSTLLLSIMMLLTVSVFAQKRYDEIKYPELNKFKETKVEEVTLDNGITFYLVEDKELPLIRVNAIVRTGALLEPIEKTGLASMTGSVMREGGSENYPAEKLNILLENKAAFMSTYIGQGSGGGSMNLLKEDFDELLPVFVDLLQNPLFPQDKIDLAKTQIKTSISRRNDNPQGIATREFSKLIYGEDNPYTSQVEYSTIDAITREDMIEFHKQAFVGNNMMIGVIGDFDTSEMKEKLREAFGSLKGGTETNLIYPEVSYNYPSTINLVDKEDVNQSTVYLGHIGGRRDNPDYAALQLMNEILSSGFSGRLMQSVRSDLGLAYSVFGSYSSNINYPGIFFTGVMTKSSTTAEAIDAIIVEIEKLQDEPVSEKELTDAKNRFLNSLVFRYDSKNKILSERLSNEYNGLPQNYFDQYVEQLKKVSISDIQRVSKTYLKPDQLQIMVVGNADEIGDQLDKYGTVNVIDVEIPLPKSDKAEVTGDATQGNEWLGKMANAIISSGTEVNTLTVQGTLSQVTPQGNIDLKNSLTVSYADLNITRKIDAPQGTIEMVIENGSGKMKMGAQEQALPPAATKPMIDEIKNGYIYVALNAQDLNAQYIGMEEMEGKEYATLKIDGASSVTFLIDPSTSLPAYSKVSVFSPQMGKEVETITAYSNWELSSGINYAYKAETKTDGQLTSTSTIDSVEVK
ncbi:MAG: insulinase family protein [Balneola sp.]